METTLLSDLETVAHQGLLCANTLWLLSTPLQKSALELFELVSAHVFPEDPVLWANVSEDGSVVMTNGLSRR